MAVQDEAVLQLLGSAPKDAIDIRSALERSVKQVARANATQIGLWSFVPTVAIPNYDEVSASLNARCSARKARATRGADKEIRYARV